MQIYRPFADLKKFHLEARDGKIGRPDEFYFDDRHWLVRYLVVQTGNWLFGREVLIAPGMLAGVNDKKKTVGVDLTLAQVEKSPPLETIRPASRYYEEQYYQYYGWQPYWTNDLLLTPEVRPVFPAPAEEQTPEPPDTRLRSSKEVTGCTLLAVDGEIGHVKDFIVGDKEWVIRYLEVDIGSWLTGRKVVVSPTWITAVNPQRREVSVKLTRQVIRSAPAYEPSQLISKDFELQVYKHYCGTGGRNKDEDEQ
jgi:hypothetical protein